MRYLVKHFPRLLRMGTRGTFFERGKICYYGACDRHLSPDLVPAQVEHSLLVTGAPAACMGHLPYPVFPTLSSLPCLPYPAPISLLFAVHAVGNAPRAAWLTLAQASGLCSSLPAPTKPPWWTY